MRTFLLGTAAAAALAAGTAFAADTPAPGKGVTIYMQMGGNAGDGATLARQTGAAAAAKPSCIAIMGHPGNEAFADLVKQAFDQGVIVTDGNAPLSELQAAYGPKG